MSNAAKIEFVNRTEELKALQARIPPNATRPTITFLRSPSGYGKTRLTERLIEAQPVDGPTCVVVDPAIRSKSRSDRVYPWFYVQRAAELSARRTVEGRREFRSFATFLRRSEYSRLNWKDIYKDLKEAASISKIMKIVVELGESLTKRGRYSPESILQDDSTFATQLAQDYVRGLANFRPTVFVVRECQNIDPESLRFFLTLGQEVLETAIICEYTSSEGKFSDDHEKLIFETIISKSELVIFELMRLDIKEFRFLLRKYAPTNKSIETAAELAWDGNLRIIKELKYRVMVGSAASSSSPLHLTRALVENVEALSKIQQLVISIVAANVEAISIEILSAVVTSINNSVTAKDVLTETERLANTEGYVTIESDYVALADEDLLEALSRSNAMTPILRLAETRLRDFYLDLVGRNALTDVPLHTALRQAVALCARTGDIVALRGLIKTLDSAIRQAYDQTLYVNIVSDVVAGREDLLDIERRELIGWASAAAYEVGDFPVAILLLSKLRDPTHYDMALLACCYGEVNRNEDALTLAGQLESRSANDEIDVLLAARLIECASVFSTGEKEEARVMHAKMRNDSAFSTSPLFGFVLRYTEIVQDFPACTPDILESVTRLRAHGFRKAAAYSELAAAMNLACEGHLKRARELVRNAGAELVPFVRDRQTIFNNQVVLELLSPKPNLTSCIEKLDAALFTARDDFSRLVLNSNRLICFSLSDQVANALHCTEIIADILAAPRFGNRDIFWPACFNAWRFFTDKGKSDQAERFRNISFALESDNSNYQLYWNARFGLLAAPPPEFTFLMQFKYHPEYLSHWLIDQEGLSVLKAKRAR